MFVLLLLLLASALFSGSEVALFSLDRSAMYRMAQTGDRASARVLALLQRPRPLYVTILLLSTLVNITAAVLSAVIVARVAETFSWSLTGTVLTEVVVLAAFLVIGSGLAPKLIASRDASSFSRRISALLLTLHSTLLPVSDRVSELLSRIQSRFRGNEANESASAEDGSAPPEYDSDKEQPEDEDNDLLESILEFSETTVREVMVSRMDMVALPMTATLSEALDLIRKSGHSRLPLYEEHLDNILGVVYAKDLLPYLAPRNGSSLREHVNWTHIARLPMFVPLGKKLDDLLKDFRNRKMHLAIVVDEYGGTAGLVTLEDVLEEIVGDIRDEHDELEETLYERIGDGVYRVDARIDLDDFADVLGVDLDTDDFDFETLGGLIFHLTGSMPVPGEEIEYPPLRIRVETVEAHRVGRVLVEVPTDAEEEVSRESAVGER